MKHKLIKTGRFTGVELEIAAFADYDDAVEAMLLLSCSNNREHSERAFMYTIVSE